MGGECGPGWVMGGQRPRGPRVMMDALESPAQSRSSVLSRYLSSLRSDIHWLKVVLLRAACTGC